MINTRSICFVVSSPFTVNGFLINHLMWLSKYFEVTLFVNLEREKLSARLDLSRIKVVDIPLERKIKIFKDINAYWQLFKYFSTSNFISVHSVTPKAGLLAMSAAFFAKIPNRHHTYTGQIWVRRKGLYRTFFKKIDWVISQCATFVMADSTSQIQFLLKEGVCKREKIGMLGSGSISGVDHDIFKSNEVIRAENRKKFLISEDICLFLYVGRISKDKGIYDLLKAFAELKKKYRNIALWIVGPDEEGIAEKLNYQDPELYSSINWIGLSSNPEIYMASADILLLPSYREGFGTVIIEAASCSLPTIAYKIDGVIDAIVDGQTGLLVKKGDIRDFRNKMEVLYCDPRLRLKLGASAQKRANADFSSRTITKAWLAFYRHLSLKKVNK
jgi:glycosyltransferase involved in cell wall biosynthesis